MTTPDAARDSVEAVRLFSDRLRAQARQPRLIQARLDGRDGMTALCAVEATLADLWPATTAKELIWLTGPGADEVLHLQARAGDGAVLAAASFRLTG